MIWSIRIPKATVYRKEVIRIIHNTYDIAMQVAGSRQHNLHILLPHKCAYQGFIQKFWPVRGRGEKEQGQSLRAVVPLSDAKGIRIIEQHPLSL